MGAITINNGGTLAFGGYLQLGTTTTNAVTVNTGGVIQSSGTVTHFDNLTLAGGTLSSNGGFGTGWGSFNLKDTLAVTANSSILNTSGNYNFLSPGANNGNQTLTINVSPSVTLTNNLPISDYDASHVYSITKSGSGTAIFNGASTYTGGTTVSSGTLALAAAAAADGTGTLTINPTGTVQTAVTGALGGGNVTLAGGTLQNTLLNAAGAANNVQNAGAGTLTLSGGASTLDFGAGNKGATFQFSGYNYASSPGTLNITNWMGNAYTGVGTGGGGTDQFVFQTTNYTNAQLAQISFVNPNGLKGTYAATQLGSGEVVANTLSPTPEPGSVVPILVGMAGLGVLIARKRRKARADTAEASAALAV